MQPISGPHYGDAWGRCWLKPSSRPGVEAELSFTFVQRSNLLFYVKEVEFGWQWLLSKNSRIYRIVHDGCII